MQPTTALLTMLAMGACAAHAADTIPLWPGGVPAWNAPSGAEKVEERGTPALPDRAVSLVSEPSITVYLPDPAKAKGAAVLIAPGGGYVRLAIDKEGHDVARWLNSLGVAAFVLKYRLPIDAAAGQGRIREVLADASQARAGVRVAIEDAARAMKIVRERAAQWNVNPDRVGMMGFSAGGHLATMLGTTEDAGARPNFLALIYPAVSRGTEATAQTPPSFLVHADDDRLAPAENSVPFYLSLKHAKVPAELHVFSTGGHGFGLRKNGNTSDAWPERFQAWLAKQGW